MLVFLEMKYSNFENAIEEMLEHSIEFEKEEYLNEYIISHYNTNDYKKEKIWNNYNCLLINECFGNLLSDEYNLKVNNRTCGIIIRNYSKEKMINYYKQNKKAEN